MGLPRILVLFVRGVLRSRPSASSCLSGSLPETRIMLADARAPRPIPPPRAPSNRLLASAPRRKEPHLFFPASSLLSR